MRGLPASRLGATLPLFIAALLAGCGPGRMGASPPDAAFTAQAVAFLDGLQARSFAEDREFCGYMGRTAAGTFAASAPVRGALDRCEPEMPGDIEVVASYHTHGGFGYEHDAELPTPEDVETDMAEGVFGYVATPGGRVWLIDGPRGVASQVCGPGCIAQDADFEPGVSGPVRARYTLEELIALFG